MKTKVRALALLMWAACLSSHGAVIAQWELNETSGLVLTDTVGGHDFTSRPSLIFGGPDLAGDGGTSISFAAATGTAPSDPTVNGGDMFVQSNAQFTAEGFFRITSQQVSNALNYVMGTRDATIGWAVWLRANGILGFIFTGSGGSIDFQGTNRVVADGLVHHFALVLDKNGGTTNETGRATLYIDGVTNYVANNIPLTYLDSDNAFRIGWRPGNNTTQWRGYLDKLRFSDAALTPAEFLTADADQDGLPNFFEDRFAFLDKNNPADAALDQDEDGLSNSDEYRQRTDLENPDTDGDGVLDGDEVNIYHANPLLADTDGDGLTDGLEIFNLHTNPNYADSDSDGISDPDEINIYHTNPTDKDSDHDGFPELVEITLGTDPNNAASVPSVASSIIALWELDDLEGQLQDSIGGRHNVTIDTAVSYGQLGVAADGGTSINFSKANSTPATANASDMFARNNLQFTAEGFFQISAASAAKNQNFIVGTRTSYGWTIWVRADDAGRGGCLGFNFQGSGGITGTDFTGRTFVADGQVHHFALVFDKFGGTSNRTGKATLYIDGNVDYIMDNIPADHMDKDDGFMIGRRSNAPFKGNLDKMRFSTLALTPAQFLIADTDHDGMPDFFEDRFAFLDKSNPADAALDQDGDGLSNLEEYRQRTDPSQPDTDGDGLTDGAEVNIYYTSPLLADTDGDTLSDGEEINNFHTNPNAADSDLDRLNDAAEVIIYKTNPMDKDTDHDGFPDPVEIAHFSDPNNPESVPLVDDSIIALWQLDEMDGVLYDSIGGRSGPHNITVDTAVSYGQPGLADDGGVSINFSAANSTPTTTYASDMFVSSNLQFTAEGFFQIYATNASTNVNFIMGTRTNLGWAVWVRPNADGYGGCLGFLFQGSGGLTGTEYMGRTFVADGRVHHFALVFDKLGGTTNGTGKATLYLNGRVDYVMDNIPANRMDKDDGFMIGRRNNAPFKGNLDNLRFSTLALAPTDQMLWAPSITAWSFDRATRVTVLHCAGMPFTVYRVQTTESLTTPAWTDLIALQASPEGTFSLSDTNTVMADRFYRLVSP